MAALSHDELVQVRGYLGVGPNVPDSDIQAIAASPEGKRILTHIQNQGAEGLGGEIGGFLRSGLGALEGKGKFTPKEILNQILTGGIRGGGVAVKPTGEGGKQKQSLADILSSADPSGGAGPGANANNTAQALYDYATQTETGIGESAIAGLTGGLGQQNQAITDTVSAAMAGGGVSSGNPAVDAAQQAYAKAYGTAEGINSADYQNMAVANDEYMKYAAYQPLINLLTQNYGSQYYKALPPNVYKNLPKSAQALIAQSGVQQQQSAGSNQVTPIPGSAGGAGTGANAFNVAQFLQGLTGSYNPAAAQNQGGANSSANASNPTS